MFDVKGIPAHKIRQADGLPRVEADTSLFLLEGIALKRVVRRRDAQLLQFQSRVFSLLLPRLLPVLPCLARRVVVH